MPDKSFSQRFRELLDYALLRRENLIRTGRSLRPESYMRCQLQKLMPNLKRNWTDEGAAIFLQEHYYEIRELIPGREENKITELDTLYTASFMFNSKPKSSCNQLALKLSLR